MSRSRERARETSRRDGRRDCAEIAIAVVAHHHRKKCSSCPQTRESTGVVVGALFTTRLCRSKFFFFFFSFFLGSVSLQLVSFMCILSMLSIWRLLHLTHPRAVFMNPPNSQHIYVNGFVLADSLCSSLFPPTIYLIVDFWSLLLPLQFLNCMYVYLGASIIRQSDSVHSTNDR